MGVDPAAAIAVGDTPWDAYAAISAGARVIGILGGAWRAAELLDAGCLAVYRDPGDLADYYDRSPLAETVTGTPFSTAVPDSGSR
jgi:phosphoglycolate phosphatase-like HAD superfamily hydrolase